MKASLRSLGLEQVKGNDHTRNGMVIGRHFRLQDCSAAVRVHFIGLLITKKTATNH